MKYSRFSYHDQSLWCELGDGVLNELSDAPWMPGTAKTGVTLPMEGAIPLPCVAPRTIVGIAQNYPGVAEINDVPLLFTKPGSTLMGTSGEIMNPFRDANVWGEPELAVVIGKRIKNCSFSEAGDAIFGYCCANDVTAEAQGGHDHHLLMSKGSDTFCPVGPCIDTDFRPADQVIRGFHNDVLLREARLSDRRLSEIETLVFISKFMTLYPGDLVLTGAPGRVRDRIFLQPGDLYRVEIEGLGVLEHVCGK